MWRLAMVVLLLRMLFQKVTYEPFQKTNILLAHRCDFLLFAVQFNKVIFSYCPSSSTPNEPQKSLMGARLVWVWLYGY